MQKWSDKNHFAEQYEQCGLLNVVLSLKKKENWNSSKTMSEINKIWPARHAEPSHHKTPKKIENEILKVSL